jgi:hypothetical protein
MILRCLLRHIGGREHSGRKMGDSDYRSLFGMPEFDSDGSPNFPSSEEAGGGRVG